MSLLLWRLLLLSNKIKRRRKKVIEKISKLRMVYSRFRSQRILNLHHLLGQNSKTVIPQTSLMRKAVVATQ